MAWLALNREVAQLTEEWGRLEVLLCDEHNWFGLNATEQAALPEGQQLRLVDELLRLKSDQSDELLAEIPKLKARTPLTVIFKLAVAAALLGPDEHPDARAIVESCMHDLAAL